MPYPISNQQDVIDGLNYVLSGPGGLGQNFAGVSITDTGYLTGNYRLPFSDTVNYQLTVDPIALSTAEMLDERTWKYTFATPEASTPFGLGNTVYVEGVTDPYYDGAYTTIGVIECTTTYVVVRTSESYAIVAPSTGGTVKKSIVTSDQDQWYSTDCNARVTVTSSGQRVFISAQINNAYTFKKLTTGPYSYTVAINRYKAVSNNDPTNPDYVFPFDKTIAYQRYANTLDATADQAETFTITSGTAANQQLQKTYFIPNATTTSGTGIGVNLNVTVAANTGIVLAGPAGLCTCGSVTIAPQPYSTANTIVEISGADGGQGYTVGDVITIPGTSLGGTSPTNDLVLTVATTSSFFTDASQETIFTTVLDDPLPGYYWYILELQWFSVDSTESVEDVIVLDDTMTFRNLTAQVIKS